MSQHTERWQQDRLFHRVVRLYFDDPEWMSDTKVEFKNGLYTLNVKVPSRYGLGYSACILAQRQGQVHVYQHHTSMFPSGLGNAIAKAEMFPDGQSRIQMLRVAKGWNPRDGHVYPLSKGVFKCTRCSNSNFTSALDCTGQSICSSRPDDWIFGHGTELEDSQLACLVDVLLCTNRHCGRYNYVLHSSRSPGGPNDCFRVIDAGMGSDDIDYKRMKLSRAMAFVYSIPMPIVEEIIDYLLPRPGLFARCVPSPSVEIASLGPVERWNLCELDAGGGTIRFRDCSRLIERTRYGCPVSYRFIGTPCQVNYIVQNRPLTTINQITE